MPPSTATYVRTPGIDLDRADSVQRQAGGRRDRTAGLGHQARPGAHAGLGERLVERVAHDRAVLLDRRRRVVREVADAETAAEVQLVDRRAGRRLDLAHEVDHLVDRTRERVGAVHLRADVAVDAGELEGAVA